MDIIKDEDKMVVPFRYIRAVDWIKTEISLRADNFPSLMFALGCFINEIDNLNPKIVKYKERNNEN